MSNGNTRIIEEFRANDGVVGGHFEGRPLLLLHHTGARTGTARITPLTYREEHGRIFIFASKGGADTHPAWYHNVVANPSVSYQVGTETRSATARVITGPERDAVYARQAEFWSVFGAYERKTDRVIPVIELA